MQIAMYLVILLGLINLHRHVVESWKCHILSFVRFQQRSSKTNENNLLHPTLPLSFVRSTIAHDIDFSRFRVYQSIDSDHHPSMDHIDTKPQKQVIFSFPPHPQSFEPAINFIREWAKKELNGTGNAISFKEIKNGVKFTFHPSSAAYLCITAVPTDYSIDLIAESLEEVDSTKPWKDLINYASNNLMNSIIWEIGETMLTDPPPEEQAYETGIENYSEVAAKEVKFGPFDEYEPVDKILNKVDPNNVIFKRDFIGHKNSPYQDQLDSDGMGVFPRTNPSDSEIGVVDDDIVDVEHELSPDPVPLKWESAPYTEEDIQFLQSLRDSGQIRDSTLIPRTLDEAMGKTPHLRSFKDVMKHEQEQAVGANKSPSSRKQENVPAEIKPPSVILEPQVNKAKEILLIASLPLPSASKTSSKDANAMKERIVTFLQSWTRSFYHLKGLGIIVDRCSDGVAISFGATVEQSSSSTSLPIVLFIKVSNDGRDIKVKSFVAYDEEDIRSSDKMNPDMVISRASLSSSSHTILQKIESDVTKALGKFSFDESSDTDDVKNQGTSTFSSSNPKLDQAKSTTKAVSAQVKTPSNDNDQPFRSVTNIDSVGAIDEAYKAMNEASLLLKENTKNQRQYSQFKSGTRTTTKRRYDEQLVTKAEQLGIDLPSLEGIGIEEYAASELQKIMRQKRGGGMLAMVRQMQGANNDDEQKNKSKGSKAKQQSVKQSSQSKRVIGKDHEEDDDEEEEIEDEELTEEQLAKRKELDTLFSFGAKMSELQLERVLEKPTEITQNLLKEAAATIAPDSVPVDNVLTVPILVEKKNETEEIQKLMEDVGGDMASTQNGESEDMELLDMLEAIDIEEVLGQHMTLPSGTTSSSTSTIKGKEKENLLPHRIPSKDYEMNEKRFDFLIEELIKNQYSGMISDKSIYDAYADLLLSKDLFIILRKKRSELLTTTTTTTIRDSNITRKLYNRIIEKSLELYQEVSILIKKESTKYLELIRNICIICRQYQSPKDELLLLNELDKLKIQYDTQFLKFLDYAIFEEQERITQQLIENNVERSMIAGHIAMNTTSNKPLTREEILIQELQYQYSQNPWLHVLNVIREGVLLEFTQRYDYLLETLYFTIKIPHDMIREQFIKQLLDEIPITDLPYLREIARNIVEYTIKQVGDENGEPIGEIRWDITDGKRKMMTPSNPDYVTMLLKDPGTYSGIMHMNECMNKYFTDDVLRNKLTKYQKELKETQGVELTFQLRNPITQHEMEIEESLAREAAIGGKDTMGVLGGPSDDSSMSLDYVSQEAGLWDNLKESNNMPRLYKKSYANSENVGLDNQ